MEFIKFAFFAIMTSLAKNANAVASTARDLTEHVNTQGMDRAVTGMCLARAWHYGVYQALGPVQTGNFVSPLCCPCERLGNCRDTRWRNSAPAISRNHVVIE